MKIKPAVLVGVLGVILFIVVAYVFQAYGVWDPPGVKPGGKGHDDHDDHDETGIEREHTESGYISDSLEGSMDLHDFLEDNGVSIDCVAGKLGIANPKTKDSVKNIKTKLGIEMSDIRAIIDECMGLEVRPDTHADDENHEPTEKVDHEEPDETDDEMVYVSDNLVGSDNLAEFLDENHISGECLAEKLGITEKELNDSAKNVKEKLMIEMTDIRFAIDDCMGLEIRPDPHEAEETVSHSNDSEKLIEVDIDEEPVEEEHDGSGRGQGGEGYGDGSRSSYNSDLPKLTGNMNLKEYCVKNGIPVVCVGEKLGIDFIRLDTTGGKLASELGMDMSELRDLILSCH